MYAKWNPWHGCVKCSPGCEHCYMYFLDKAYGAVRDGSEIRRNSDALFRAPVAKDRKGNYKVQSGQKLNVCMTSDFFLEQADEWRPAAWDMIRARPDVIFWILTKRAGRIRQCLPLDWGLGYENVVLNVTAETQEKADLRVPALLDIPAKHRGVCVAPWIAPVSLRDYLSTSGLEQVCGGGENYDGARVCDFDWVRLLREECASRNITFCWYETGTYFRKDGRTWHIPSKTEQSRQAFYSGMNFQGRKPKYILKSPEDGHVLRPEELYTPSWCAHCIGCANRMICGGCGGRKCNHCGWGRISEQEALSRAAK